MVEQMSTFRIVIEGTPPSVNHLYGHRAMGKRVIKYKLPRAKEYTKQLGEAFLKKYPKHLPFLGQCEMLIRVYYGNRRKRDIDNVGKVVLDSFNKLVYDDDSQIKRLVLEKLYLKGKGKTEIVIEEL